jgi:hypothetical protein
VDLRRLANRFSEAVASPTKSISLIDPATKFRSLPSPYSRLTKLSAIREPQLAKDNHKPRKSIEKATKWHNRFLPARSIVATLGPSTTLSISNRLDSSYLIVISPKLLLSTLFNPTLFAPSYQSAVTTETPTVP